MINRIKQGLVKLVDFIDRGARESAKMRIERFEAQYNPEPSQYSLNAQELRGILANYR